MAIADMRRHDQRQEDRARLRRPPEQGRHRRRRRRASGSTRRRRTCSSAAPTRRPRWRWPRWRPRRRGRSSSVGAATSRLTNEQCTPYTVHYAYDTVALAKGTGSGGRQERRQELVLPDRRLRVRARAGEGHRRRRQGGRRHGRRLGAPSADRVGLLVVPAAGADQQGADPRPGQRRRRHHQLDQGGQRVRRHQDDEARRPADVHQRHPLAGPEDHAGHVPDRQLVLEPDAETRAWGRTLLREDEAHAVVAAGRRLLGGAATT